MYIHITKYGFKASGNPLTKSPYCASAKVGDRTGELTAEMNIADLKVVLGINDVDTR